MEWPYQRQLTGKPPAWYDWIITKLVKPMDKTVENVKMGKIIGNSPLILDDYRIIEDVSEKVFNIL